MLNKLLKLLILSPNESLQYAILNQLKKIDKVLTNRDVAIVSTVKSVKKIRTANDEYVYDIGMRNTNNPWFFGNNILLHNSSYFSAYPLLKKEIENNEIEWTKESIIDLYNNIAKSVSATFPKFLEEKLNVPVSRSTGVIASSRETVSSTGLWITKKRYACLMIDKDNIRHDVNKPGKIKAMGLDLKRSDTPVFVQKFLSEILLDVLTEKASNDIIVKIRKFKEMFIGMKPWQQGTPRAVNKLSYYGTKLEEASIQKMKGNDVENVRVPGHVAASLAWNRLREQHRDRHSMQITDGQKILVCKLKPNDYNITSIAIPVDETKVPTWFMKLPFDSDDMMESLIDQKVENLLGVLNLDLSRTKREQEHLETLFDFSGI